MQLGHEVIRTGVVWQGWRFPNKQLERRHVEDQVRSVIDARPDAVLVLRPSALRAEMVEHLRAHVKVTAAWFCDDPVLVKVQSDFVAQLYDVTLHAGSVQVLDLYEKRLGVRGLSFPFWTDSVAFPRQYSPDTAEVDLVFIGNTHTRVKAWRYEWISALPLTRRIVGRVAQDPAGIHAGYAEDDAALASAALKGRLGLNISQRFADYGGTTFDYPGLANLGEFPVPSRVVQLAALGVPIVSFVGCEAAEADWKEMFPPVIRVRSADEAVAIVQRWRTDMDSLRALSEHTNHWYRRHYTALSRAKLLTRVLRRPDDWLGKSTRERANAYMDVRRAFRLPGILIGRR